MFDEGQYFAPLSTKDDGSLTVHLGAGHPGLDDPVYRQRRDLIATAADRWRPGEPVPTIDYTDEEHEVWRIVSEDLLVKHEEYACREYLDGKAAFDLPTDRVPQLEELSAKLAPLTGFRYRPAAGVVPLRDFYGTLADREFWATQYVRHHSVPLYTPEPDVLHEVVGHGNTLADRRFTRLYEAAGNAARRVRGEDALRFVSKVFWFTLEFGVVYEGDQLKAYGAGILSSPGEIEEFRGMTIRPLDITAMGTTDYDITHYQEVLFAAKSWSQIEDVVGGFWSGCTDDSIAALRSTAAA
ncbi:MAG: phenylalanine 4-monooxygenase [Nocardioidaceae bacterium]